MTRLTAQFRSVCVLSAVNDSVGSNKKIKENNVVVGRHLHRVVNGIERGCMKIGMRISIDKTEVQMISKREMDLNIVVQENKLKQVKEFCLVYLCGKFNEEGGSKPDVQRRIGLACDASKRLCKIWRASDISQITKVKVYETLVLSILMYNAETWALTEELNRRLKVFEMSCLRRIAGVARLDCVRNEDTRRNIIKKLELRRICYFCYVAWMDQNRFPFIFMHGGVNGTRVRGRPRQRWLDTIKKNCDEEE